MTDERPIPAPALRAFADVLDPQVSIVGDEATLTMSVPRPGRWLHLRLVATLADGRPDSLEAYEEDAPFASEEFDLPEALAAFGLPGLPMRKDDVPSNHVPANPDGLLAEALRSIGRGRPGAPDEVRALQGIVRSRVEGLGFDPPDWISLDALRLLSCATEVSHASYAVLSGSNRLRTLCRAFPMLAGEIVLCGEVREEEPGVSEFEALLETTGLDLDRSSDAGSLPPMGGHVVRWLKGLELASPLWDAHRARHLPDMLAGMRCPLPTDLPGFEAMLRAADTFRDCLRAAWQIGYEEQERRRHGRLAYLAEGILAAGGDWDAVNAAWRDYGGQPDKA